ncbi:MAG: hypothetical protein AAGA93_19550 [Actinomycetota bacterium]
MTSAGESMTEEPWEGEVGKLLGELPSVDPPDGFIDRAVDRRPLNAGRTMAALGLLTAVLALLSTVGDAVRPAEVVPEIEDLVARHDLAATVGLSSDNADAADRDDPGEAADAGDAAPAGSTGDADDTGDAAMDRGHRPFSLPAGFEAEGEVTVEDVRQAVYARGDEAVSVFVQEGRVDWSALPADRLGRLGELRAWVDQQRAISVIEVDGSIVTVIGLQPAELDEAIQETAAGRGRSLGERATDLAEAVVSNFGYAPVG